MQTPVQWDTLAMEKGERHGGERCNWWERHLLHWRPSARATQERCGAFLLDLAGKTVYARASAGELPAVKIRGQRRIKRAKLDRWLDQQPRGGERERDDG